VQGRLESDLADHGVIHTTGLDFDLVVAVPVGLCDKRKAEDADPRVEIQVRGRAHASGQVIFGVDGGPEVRSDGADDDRGYRRDRTDQQLPHPDILAYRERVALFGAANEQVARYR